MKKKNVNNCVQARYETHLSHYTILYHFVIGNTFHLLNKKYNYFLKRDIGQIHYVKLIKATYTPDQRKYLCVDHKRIC